MLGDVSQQRRDVTVLGTVSVELMKNIVAVSTYSSVLPNLLVILLILQPLACLLI